MSCQAAVNANVEDAHATMATTSTIAHLLCVRLIVPVLLLPLAIALRRNQLAIVCQNCAGHYMHLAIDEVSLWLPGWTRAKRPDKATGLAVGLKPNLLGTN